jgi:beta-galactosidase
MPWLTGAAQWIYKDFSTPLRPDNPVPYVNQKGVVERDGTKKEAYFVFQSYWTSRLMAHIYGHSWPVRWGKEGEEKLIKVYSNAPEAELFLNGQSYGVRHRDPQDFPAAGLRWKLVFRPGENLVRVVARRGKATVSDSIRFVYQTAEWGKPARLRLEKLDDSTVRVQVLDAQGVRCLDAASWIRWGLTGDGRLEDDLGTSTGSRKVQAYNGEAMIHVEGKNFVISAASEGIKTEFLIWNQ